MKKYLGVLLWIFVFVHSASAEKMLIAVLDLKPKGVSKMLAGAVTESIRTEMIKTGLFTVVERAQMDMILKEQGLQMSGCTDQACAVQIGKLLSARKLLVGELNKIGKKYVISARIVDVEKGTSDFAAKVGTKKEDMLDEAAVKLTRRLVENITGQGEDYFAYKKTPSGYYLRGLVPGWGQFYTDHNVKGYIFSIGFTAALGASAYGWISYSGAKKEYDDVPRGSAQSEYDDKYGAKKQAAVLFLASGGAAAGIYLLNWLDLLIFSKPDFGKSDEASMYESGDLFAISYVNADFGRKPAVFAGIGLKF